MLTTKTKTEWATIRDNMTWTAHGDVQVCTDLVGRIDPEDLDRIVDRIRPHFDGSKTWRVCGDHKEATIYARDLGWTLGLSVDRDGTRRLMFVSRSRLVG